MIYVRVSDEIKEQLKKEAEEKGLTVSSYVRMLILERNK